MKLYNTLSRTKEDFEPLGSARATLYSCGPTVYDHIHIGNLSAFIAADTLRRTLQSEGYSVKHVMNFTDVDDKTIRRSAERFADMPPMAALRKLTKEYEDIFLDDMRALGNDVEAVTFIRATEAIEGMRALIRELFDEGFAYVSDDGVYFSIEKYKISGKKYGQLLELSSDNTGGARINNDEYDKESVHDFALWKKQKGNEPAWEFELDGEDMTGRPGWHIECSAMSVASLGQPFDVHTGGIDLIFPHHENEIAQSTAANGNVLAKYFVHNEHLLVDGKKMSKSLQNFFTLGHIRQKGFDPLAFRIMVLQSHYRNQANFTRENLEGAQNRLQTYRVMADLRWQPNEVAGRIDSFNDYIKRLASSMADDMDTPHALAVVSEVGHLLSENITVHPDDLSAFENFLKFVDLLFGIGLLASEDIDDAQKRLLTLRQQAKDKKDWETADKYRDSLKHHLIGVRDTALGQIWFRI